MMMPPHDHPEAAQNRRLNLLLSYGGWQETSALDQLAHLLEPMGIACLSAESGEEAADIIRDEIIHIAVVDLGIPLARLSAKEEPGGGRILQLLRRLEPSPPTVIVRPRPSAVREGVRELSEALRDGAFAVVDRPFHLETMLEVMRRVLRRHYRGYWPESTDQDAFRN
jgi:DNA-binding response OmpR family regulator